MIQTLMCLRAIVFNLKRGSCTTQTASRRLIAQDIALQISINRDHSCSPNNKVRQSTSVIYILEINVALTPFFHQMLVIPKPLR